MLRHSLTVTTWNSEASLLKSKNHGFYNFSIFICYLSVIFFLAPGYEDMFESGNFKRRKRMRRHSYKPSLYKGWLGDHTPSPPFTALYRSYPHPLYSTMSRWEHLLTLKKTGWSRKRASQFPAVLTHKKGN